MFRSQASAKRRRSKAQIEEEKQTESKQKVELQQQLAQMAAMQNEIHNLQQQIGAAESMRNEVQQMFNDGVIKQNLEGKFEAVLDASESEQIKSQLAEQSKRRPIGEADIDRINADLDKMEQDGGDN